MTPQPQQYFLISKEELFRSAVLVDDIAAIRSRPAPSQDIGLIGLTKINDRLRLLYPDDLALQINESQLVQEQKEHDAATAAQAREKALNDVSMALGIENNSDEHKIIESLRTEAPK